MSLNAGTDSTSVINLVVEVESDIFIIAFMTRYETA